MELLKSNEKFHFGQVSDIIVWYFFQSVDNVFTFKANFILKKPLFHIIY